MSQDANEKNSTTVNTEPLRKKKRFSHVKKGGENT
jgi:hypothetical protein